MTKSSNVIKFICLFFLCFSAACSGAAPKQETTTLRFAWTLWQGDYTLLVAERMGFFTKHGVQVKPVYYGLDSNSITDLAGNQLDGGVYTMSDTLFASRVADVRAVMVSDQGSQYSIVAAPEIKTVNDLRGKRVGLNIHSSSEAFVYDMLKTKRMTSQDVTYVEVSPNDVLKRIPNDIDAGLVWEPYTTQALKKGMVLVYQNDDQSLLIPRLIVFRQSVVEKYPEDIQGFILAWDEAVQYRRDHPEESLAMISKATNISTDDLKLNGNIELLNIVDSRKSFALTSGMDYRSAYYMAGFTRDFLLMEGYLSDFPNFSILIDPAFLK